MTVQVAPQKVPSSGSALDAGYVWFDGELIPEAEAKVSVLTHALHYGTSVFEGIRAYETERGPAVFQTSRAQPTAHRICQDYRYAHVIVRPRYQPRHS